MPAKRNNEYDSELLDFEVTNRIKEERQLRRDRKTSKKKLSKDEIFELRFK